MTWVKGCGAGVALGVFLASGAFAQDVLFLTGNVKMENGAPPHSVVSIERICGGVVEVQTITNRAGRYFYRGESAIVRAHQAGAATFTAESAACSLRASLPGYTSTSVDVSLSVVAHTRTLPDLVLRRRTMASLPDGLEVPRRAAKSWDAAQKAVAAQKWPEAEHQLRSVVKSNPQMAGAWTMLGLVSQNQRKFPDSRRSYERAIEINPKLLAPRALLTSLEIESHDWQGAVDSATKLAALDPRGRYPDAYLHLAIAQYQLNDFDGAEASIKVAMLRDRQHRLPRTEYVLGLILEARRDYDGAREHLERYIAEDPRAADVGDVKTRIGNLGKLPKAEVAATENASDLELPVDGDTWVPGGMKALASAARMEKGWTPESFFADYCRTVLRSERETDPQYLAALRAYFPTIVSLAREGEPHGDAQVISLSLASDAGRKNATRLLPLLGWKVDQDGDSPVVDLGDQPQDGLRQPILAAFGVDAIGMQTTLESGKTFSLTVPSEDVRVADGSAWMRMLDSVPPFAGGLAELFVRDARYAKVYAGLSDMEGDAAAMVIAGIGLRTLVDRYSSLLPLYGGAFNVAGAKALTPGGAEAEPAWTKLAGASPRRPSQFFQGLLERDHGKLAAFYSAIARSDAAHQRFFTATPSRTERFYAAYRDSKGPRQGWPASDFEDLPLDDSGQVRFSGGRRAWTSTSESDDAVLLQPGTLEALIQISKLEKARGAALDEASTSILAKHYTQWKTLFPYFETLGGLGRDEFQALVELATAARSDGDAERNLVMGEWNSLVKLIAMGVKAGSITGPASATAFREACSAAASGNPSVRALEALRAMSGAASAESLDDAVRTRMLRFDGRRQAALDRIYEMQKVPRLDDALRSKDDAESLAALSGLVYAATLDPEGLLVSEDSQFLRKHLFVISKDADLFPDTALHDSSSDAGSYFVGGFMDLEHEAAALAVGSRIVKPGEAAAALTEVRAVSGPSGDPAPTLPAIDFHASSRLVEVYATITDSRGRYIDDVTRDQVAVLDDGTPQPVVAFEDRFAAVSVTLLLDTTTSMQATLPALKSAAFKLIERLRPEDSMAVYSFTSSVSLLQPFTTDKLAAKRAVLGTSALGGTALYDALIRVTRDLSGRTGKKVIVVFTDGRDNSSTLTYATAILRAKSLGVPIYTIAQGEAVQSLASMKELSDISKSTGGMSFAIESPKDIGKVFDSLSEDLMHGYMLVFHPQSVEGHSWRRIEVVLKTKGRKVRAREGYYP